MSDLLTRLDAAHQYPVELGDMCLLEDLCEEAAERIRELESINADLYEALQGLLERGEIDYIPTKYWDTARAAMAKARGEEQPR